MKSTDAFLYHISDYLSDDRNIKADQLKSMYVRYGLLTCTMLVLFFFHRRLPFPFPHLVIVCMVVLGINTFLHLLTLKKGLLRKIFPLYLYFDSAAAPFIFLFTGGFLSPFIITNLVSCIATAIVNTNDKKISLKVFSILLLGYLLVALLQKGGILPNYMAFSREMMHNGYFFYLVLGINCFVITAGYILVIILNFHVSSILDEMKNSFDSILRGIISDTGQDSIDCLVRNLSETLHARCVVAGELVDRADTIRTLSVWENGERSPAFECPLRESVFGAAITGKKLFIERDVRSRFPGDPLLERLAARFFFGVTLFDSKNRAMGILCIVNDRPIEKMYLLEPLVTIFSTRAAAELERKIAAERQLHTEQQLAQAHKMGALGQLAGGIAHDFNNMLGVITGYASMLLVRIEEESPLRRTVSQILATTGKATELIGSLSRFVRKEKLVLTRLDVNETVSETVAFLERTIVKNITIVKSCVAGPSLAMGDRTLLQNVLMNLAINARDAMEKRAGSISFLTGNTRLNADSVLCKTFQIEPGEYVTVEVADTGSGMSKEILGHLFEPFFTTKPKGKGTGLGLANVWGYVENYKGAIEVKSEEGKGSSFVLYLPVPVVNDE
jgi:signal transduction histidine kinase